MNFPLYIVDAFTLNGQPFTGNGAAVCVLDFDDDISDDIKQKIAFEINLSETAFVANAWNKDSKVEANCYTLRWFTPTIEVQLCGHATLASARVMFDRNEDKSVNKIKFETKFKGSLETVLDENNLITLDFPINDCQPIDKTSNPWISEIIKNIEESGVDCVEDIQYSYDIKYLLIKLKDSPELDLISKLSPNFTNLSKIDTKDLVIAVIVTQKANQEKGVDFYSRFFAPWMGVNEDPVCGSAHTVLMPYWMKKLDPKSGQINRLVGKQCSKRGGIVICRSEGQTVHLSGHSNIFISGTLNI